MRTWFRSGRPWIWLTAGAVSISLLAMLALVALLGLQGMRLFWPQPVYQFQLTAAPGQPDALLGEIYAAGPRSPPPDAATAGGDGAGHYVIRTGGADAGRDFYRVPAARVVTRHRPPDLLLLERGGYGKDYGFLQGMTEDGQPLTADDMPRALQQRLASIETQRRLAAGLRTRQQVELRQRAGRLTARRQQWLKDGQWTPLNQALFGTEQGEIERLGDSLRRQLAGINKEMDRDSVLLRDAQGATRLIPLREIERAWYPNAMGATQKIQLWAGQIGRFVARDAQAYPAQAGVFPAIVGTLLLVMLMSVMVMPLGVMAAVYLHEYAGTGWLTRLIRISVGNLAGVPSIVYGVFGLGFFVYVLGGTLDKLFYADTLPNPTFGTPGLLWAALTLALLTLPVVIVATEEGLSRIPPSLRHGSLALGATRAETLWRVVLPGAAPAMITGLILAVARAAGETAPLMLVGVIKSAPLLPVDGVFPYLHADRKFMHLGFQIYDMALQSPDSDAVRPLVFATALLLVVIVVGLNLAAIGLRHRLREKYRALAL
ncbi:phosphate ABC transporter permease PstA [Acerihabitans arboris]|uniref:Phosphate transport system permease protein PstA n=1 Tax=Acerihabitans arboris TaxID=2691583 RepID=A0A845SQJ9_9GAMM|nr:phosphate ABC transporter permease PstA [Acerihabitans arboris]NDL65397.1 phosphate ABC transporter permease PstA [Acerihabitans arboris]